MGRNRQEQQGIFTAPMDHSYRANMGNDNGNGSRGPRRPGFSSSYPVVDPEPLPMPREDAASRVFAFVEDLFFLSKIQETGRKMNVKVEFVKNDALWANAVLQSRSTSKSPFMPPSLSGDH